MKTKFFQVFFIVSFLVSFIFFCFRFLDKKNPILAFDYKSPLYDQKEAFDPSLTRLNTVNKLKDYCDSLFMITYGQTTAANCETGYTNIVGSVIRKRFYWGYSSYSFNDNYLAVIFSKLTHWGYASPVVPDDILKYPYGACSQQSIVMMEVLKRKGFSTRKVEFMGDNKIGHFAFEVYYNNNWHFHDPTLEPDTAILNKYDRPSIEFIAKNPHILLAAYKQTDKKDANFFLDVFSNYSYGKPDVFSAPNALLLHNVTKFLSGTAWIFFLLAYILVRWYRKKPAFLKFIAKSYKKEIALNYPSSSESTA